MDQSQLPNWVQIVQALGPTCATVGVGCFAAYIAWRQHKIAKDKLRLDLFNRRYEYFSIVQKFLVSIYSKGDMDYNALNEFDRGILGYEFVFDKELVSFIENIRNSALQLNVYNSELKNLPVGQNRSDMVKQRRQEFEFLLEQYKLMVPKFSKTMRFD